MPYSTYRPHHTDKDEWQVNSVDYRVSRRNALFEQLRSDSYETRAQALAQLLANVESWTRLAYDSRSGLNGLGLSTSPNGFSNNMYADYSMYGPEARSDSPKIDKIALQEALKTYLVLILRASIDCPFADVRRKCRYILYRVSKLSAPRPGSFSIASQSVKSSLGRSHAILSSSFLSEESDSSQLDGPSDQLDSRSAQSPSLAAAGGFETQRRASPSLRQLHISCYQASGRITNLGRILSYFPRFYETTIMLHDELIRKTGTPLQRVTRLYLCLMAAAESKSQYHISYYTYKYLQLGEHLEWLEGIDKAPRRVQKLAIVNSILAHQPWKTTRAHIQDLLGRSKDAVHTSDQWTMGELCQAMCILTVVHSQARFVLGCGVVPEPDTFGGACIRKATRNQHTLDLGEQRDGLNVVPLFMTSPHAYASKTTLTSMMAIPTVVDFSRRLSNGSEGESMPSLLRKRRLSVGGQHQNQQSEENSSTAKIPVNPILEDMSRYCRPEGDISDETFDITSDEYSILDLSEFNWEDRCCPLIGRIVPGLERILEQTLTEAQEAAGEMDEGFLFSDSHGPVDQRPLREAVWNFVLRLYGVHQDGYRYQDVNLLLNKSARRFLKKVCFNAVAVSRHDWATVGKGLTDPEKVLLTLLASHARLSASLLYAFRYCD
ncbi:PA26 p53-induced protein-domain-containing protein [Protomyces lactucae-debilis]|uniref:PA26 p53-induced protein-domain-containing protein n=1 Tax=Protomyces lactucae-debilis TaxID=2754530 RepID=A0A1Y2F9A7_PROLT|nr:PA26 p53-induced protein-domain-containing protein [Protomyces lactucae-debilis]ORY80500.1 PA26 p53-induced protein-domain-containing protein [Protomyces lactucae-debilis]